MEPQTRIAITLVVASAVSVVLHNMFRSATGINEPFFFTIAALTAFGFMSVALWALVTHAKHGTPHDIWKLGWLGGAGLPLGAFLGPAFFILLGFFGFFLFKRHA